MILVILQVLSLPVWWLFAVLSIPGNGIRWHYWITFGPLWASPALIIFAFVVSEALLDKERIGRVIMVMLLPPIIPFGYPIGLGILAILFYEIFA